MVNAKSNTSFDLISPFQGDPFVGHLSTPITSSNITKSYLSLLPAYKQGLSPLLRGINIGFAHGYFLLGPFVKLGPLRDSQVGNFIGFVSTISLIIILTVGLLNAMFCYKGIVKSNIELAELACKVEIDILKKPIGKQDQFIAVYGGIHKFIFNRNCYLG